MDKNDSMDFFNCARILVMRRKLVGNGALVTMSNSRSTGTCGCPVAAFQKMISGKYKLRIVWDLKDGPLRYGEIRTGLLRGSDGTREIAPRVLSRELKALTQTGLIDRKDYGVVPPKVEYRLTEKGQSFVPVISAIRKWGARHLSDAAAQEKVDRIATPELRARDA
jgi:DNA-binding HxlR family transcriptional regulator